MIRIIALIAFTALITAPSWRCQTQLEEGMQ